MVQTVFQIARSHQFLDVPKPISPCVVRMEVNISDLTSEPSIYPRGGKNEKTIEAYIEALTLGAQFPPIKIQRVFNYPEDNGKTDATLILDGIHRWFAFKESGIKKIAAVEWKDKPLDYEKNKTALLLESAKCNISHGDRLSPGDKKRIAREIATSDQECKWTEEALAEKLGVIQQTVNTWISDIRARQKAGRNTVVLRLSRLGWPQEKISEIVGINQQRISQITNNTNFSEIGNLLSQGHDMDYIARHCHMDLALIWALRLEGKTDQEKFKELGWGLRTWDQWNFNECLPREIHVNDKQSVFHWGDKRFGDDWPARHRSRPKEAVSTAQGVRSGEAGGPGRIPAQMIAHILYYFSDQNDLVFDPMAEWRSGGGHLPRV